MTEQLIVKLLIMHFVHFMRQLKYTFTKTLTQGRVPKINRRQYIIKMKVIKSLTQNINFEA